MLQIYEVINNLNMVDEDELTEEVIEPEAARRGSQIELSKLMVRTAYITHHAAALSAVSHVTLDSRRNIFKYVHRITICKFL